MATAINLDSETTAPGDYITNIATNGKYVVENNTSGVIGIWGPFTSPDQAQPVAPYGRLAVSANKWGCRMLAPGYYFIQASLGSGKFKMRHWNLMDYIIGKLHGM
jgi:hypothetical protein